MANKEWERENRECGKGNEEWGMENGIEKCNEEWRMENRE